MSKNNYFGEKNVKNHPLKQIILPALDVNFLRISLVEQLMH